jgi:hypothetical protein
MSRRTWPEVSLPAPDGPTAHEHLERIRLAARRAGPDNLLDVEWAITACLKGKCLQRGKAPRRGRPPPDDEHRVGVLLARAYAAESEWDKCLVLLLHGVPPEVATRPPTGSP